MNDRKEINEIKEVLKGLLDRLDKLENTIPLPLASFKYYQVDLPEDGERLFFIDNVQSTILSKIFNISNMNDVKRFENGLFFETKEEAEQYLKECKLIFKLKQWAKLKNDGWKPDWSNDDEEKYYITYFKDKSLGVSWEITWGMINFTKLPYFKTSEITQECIDIFGDEIKEVLCNEVE